MADCQTSGCRLSAGSCIRCRFLRDLNDWLTPQALHYVFTRTPAATEDGKPIYDPDFERLARFDTPAAENQLIAEGNAFFDALPERDRRRIEYQATQREQARIEAKAYARARRKRSTPPPTIPGL